MRGLEPGSVTGAENDPRVGIQSHLAEAVNYNRWIADQARRHVGRRVVDAGCGSGNLARLMLDRDLVVGVEVWRPFVDLLRQRFASAANFTVLEFDLADPGLTEALREHRPDSAVCSNVLEHVEDDRAALMNLVGALPAGAPFFLLVPAFPALYGEHDRADHHFRRYTKRSLHRTVASVPLRIERQYYMNMPGFFAWFVLGRVLRRGVGENEVGAYERVVPLVRGLEERVRPPLGQSLVALMRKRG